MKKIISIIIFLFYLSFTSCAQTISFEDNNFKNCLLLAAATNTIAIDSLNRYIKIDLNNDGEIQQNEALNVYKLTTTTHNIFSLSGIEYFTNLRYLTCADNYIDSLDLSALVNLKYLDCVRNSIAFLNLNNLTKLDELFCGVNRIPNLNLLEKTSLKTLSCYDNSITSLNLSGFNNLQILNCRGNRITDLNINGLMNLNDLQCGYNLISSLDVSDCQNLTGITCNNNKIVSLDVRKLKRLEQLHCSNNLLTTMFLKNGKNNSTQILNNNLSFFNNPMLREICTDFSDYDALNQLLINMEYNHVMVYLFCNSDSTSNYFKLNGNVRLDLNNNGCTQQDALYSNLKVKIKSATDSGYAIADILGNFDLPVDSGTYKLTPVLPNNYFISTPSTVIINLPIDTIPASFCITPNGTNTDLSVTVIPIRAARPGFSDATYKIIFKNNGNTSQSGTIQFMYNENYQDYISATAIPINTAPGSVTFGFTNLVPFEKREIIVTMRTNAPTDNPPVNVGDILNLSVYLSLADSARDEYIKNNYQNIYHAVVGSIDPNDKTCLEGNTVTPDIIGDFVNYLIRFENTGTANAENVVVTDFIDLAKFDISTLEITSTSHSCKTLISNGNKVQFVFDNINLPFTDPNKYGYVAFKIKTRSNLVVGDSLKNSADIYFDYNLPIKTNTATTKITNLILAAKNNSTKDGSLQIYPNPSSGNFTIHFESKGSYPISVKVMDLKGSTLFENNVNHSEKSIITVDESNLSDGIYLINITSGKDNWMQKVMIVK